MNFSSEIDSLLLFLINTNQTNPFFFFFSFLLTDSKQKLNITSSSSTIEIELREAKEQIRKLQKKNEEYKQEIDRLSLLRQRNVATESRQESNAKLQMQKSSNDLPLNTALILAFVAFILGVIFF